MASFAELSKNLPQFNQREANIPDGTHRLKLKDLEFEKSKNPTKGPQEYVLGKFEVVSSSDTNYGPGEIWAKLFWVSNPYSIASLYELIRASLGDDSASDEQIGEMLDGLKSDRSMVENFVDAARVIRCTQEARTAKTGNVYTRTNFRSI